VDQDALYSRMAAESGPPLAHLAAAYELDPNQQRDLLQELHFSLWRNLATFHNQCFLRTWVYRVAHNTASSYVCRQSRSRRMRRISLEGLDELVNESNFEQLVDDAAEANQSFNNGLWDSLVLDFDFDGYFGNKKDKQKGKEHRHGSN
jgi:DNA-directed RNA polymerase specialized sigma24 family protein